MTMKNHSIVDVMIFCLGYFVIVSLVVLSFSGSPVKKETNTKLFRRHMSSITSDDKSLPMLRESSRRIFFIRHGEVINPGGDRKVYYGAMDVSLSSLGKEEAKAAARYLQLYDLDIVASSPLSRAIFGAEQIIKLQKKNQLSDVDAPGVLILDGFKELDRGSWCGLTKDEIGVEMMRKFDACDEKVTPDGGESLSFLENRVLSARDELLKQVPIGRAGAIVSHLQVTRCILGDALGIPTSDISDLEIATASITCIDYDSTSGKQVIHFRSFKPNSGLPASNDGAN